MFKFLKNKELQFYLILILGVYFYYNFIFKEVTLHQILNFKSGILILIFSLLFLFLKTLYYALQIINNKNYYFNLFFNLGIFLILSGILISLNTRNSKDIFLGEGETYNLNDISLKLIKVDVGEYKNNIFLSKKVDTLIEINGENKTINLFPPKKLLGYYFHITQFGFAPHLTIKNPQGQKIFKGYVMLGTFPLQEEISPLIQKEKTPDIMLGVGYFPPHIDDIFFIKNFPYTFYLKIIRAKINNKIYNLNTANYYKYITKGKLKNPQYKLIIFKDNKVFFNGDLKTKKIIYFNKNSVSSSGKIKYYIDINVVKDNGLSIILGGLNFLLLSALIFSLNFLFKFLKNRKIV